MLVWKEKDIVINEYHLNRHQPGKPQFAIYDLNAYIKKISITPRDPIYTVITRLFGLRKERENILWISNRTRLQIMLFFLLPKTRFIILTGASTIMDT